MVNSDLLLEHDLLSLIDVSLKSDQVSELINLRLEILNFCPPNHHHIWTVAREIGIHFSRGMGIVTVVSRVGIVLVTKVCVGTVVRAHVCVGLLVEVVSISGEGPRVIGVVVRILEW